MAIVQKDFDLSAEELERLSTWAAQVGEQACLGDDFIIPISVVFTFTTMGTRVSAFYGMPEDEDEIVIRNEWGVE